jgi:hypothetical protein
MVMNLNSCQSQKISPYEERVYDFLNEVYKSENRDLKTSEVGYIDSFNHLDKSTEDLNDDLLKTLLNRATSYNQLKIPDSVLNYKNWKVLKCLTTTEKFDQNKILTSKLRFVDSKTNHDDIKIIYIKGILFYGNYVIIITNHGGTIPIARLYKKEGQNYQFITITSYPPLGDE